MWLSLSYYRSGGPDGKKASTTQNISRREKKTLLTAASETQKAEEQLEYKLVLMAST